MIVFKILNKTEKILELNQTFKKKLNVSSAANFMTLRELYEFIK